jgi:hypothetical protein
LDSAKGQAGVFLPSVIVRVVEGDVKMIEVDVKDFFDVYDL